MVLIKVFYFGGYDYYGDPLSTLLGHFVNFGFSGSITAFLWALYSRQTK